MSFRDRVVWAVVSVIFEEAAIFAVWMWGLPQFGVNLHVSVLVSAMVVFAVYSYWAFVIGNRALMRKPLVGLPSLVGGKGRVKKRLAPEGTIIIERELWQARSLDGVIEAGEQVMVMGQDGLKLTVRRYHEE